MIASRMEGSSSPPPLPFPAPPPLPVANPFATIIGEPHRTPPRVWPCFLAVAVAIAAVFVALVAFILIWISVHDRPSAHESSHEAIARANQSPAFHIATLTI